MAIERLSATLLLYSVFISPRAYTAGPEFENTATHIYQENTTPVLRDLFFIQTNVCI